MNPTTNQQNNQPLHPDKIAASLEREVMRDLYDLSLLEAMGTFDLKTLLARLSHISRGRQKPQILSLVQSAYILRQRVQSLSELKLKKL